MALLKWRHDAYLNALALHLVEGGLRDAKLLKELRTCLQNLFVKAISQLKNRRVSVSVCVNTFG